MLSIASGAVIAFLHHRYRVTGGEEYVAGLWRGLVADELGEETSEIGRDSSAIGRPAAAKALVRGGSNPDEVAAHVRSTGARIVHAHNLLPTFGWRALAAAQEAGAATVLHLHNYRLVCAVGTCVEPSGSDCTRCSGRNTAPGLLHRCRGNVIEGAAYATGLARSQRRSLECAGQLIVPSQAGLSRLRELGAGLPEDRVTVIAHPLAAPDKLLDPAAGEYVLVTARLSREKGVDLAIEACRAAGLPLVICGDGPESGSLRALAVDADVRFEAPGAEAELRARARVVMVPSRAAETFGMAAATAMASGLPVVATRSGALSELGAGAVLAEPAPAALAAAARAAWDDAAQLGSLAAASAADRCAPARAASALAEVYARAQQHARTRQGEGVSA